MSITRYLQQESDGSYVIREIEERIYPVGNLDDAIAAEKDEVTKGLLKQAKEGRALKKVEVDKNLADQRKLIEGK